MWVAAEETIAALLLMLGIGIEIGFWQRHGKQEPTLFDHDSDPALQDQVAGLKPGPIGFFAFEFFL
jgi:hypothetical protein